MTDTKADSLVDQLVQQIQEKIASGEYGIGQRLRQVALANEFQVSRTPIRHALSQLAALGLVDNDSQSGSVVKSQTPKAVRDMYRVRAEVEGLAAELAAQWITDRQLARLRAVHERFVAAVSNLNQSRDEGAHRPAAGVDDIVRDWVSSNDEFHALIYGASCNEHLIRVVNDLKPGSSRGLIAASALGMYKHRMERNIADHGAILAALEARDSDLSRSAMSSHVFESGEFVAAWLENHHRG